LIAAIFLHPASLLVRFLSWSPLVLVGRVSYGVYLFHLIIAALTGHYIHWVGQLLGFHPLRAAPFLLTGVVALLVIASLSVGFSIVHYYFIEEPFLSLRDHESFRTALPSLNRLISSRRTALTSPTEAHSVDPRSSP
jgi:peptidoglycan/LPS O-acetylase OafA/YrhL